MVGLPKKLKVDAIVEPLCEVRFECEESVSLPEIVVGRLAEFQPWTKFAKVRLPISEIPASIRSQDPSLRNQPVLELRKSDGSQLVKIGANVLSLHRLVPYPLWEIFKPEIDGFIDFLFSKFENFKATRLGFRYVNGFTASKHGVNDVRNLNFSVNVANKDLEEPQNLNYRLNRSEEHVVLVRIASPEFVSGPVGNNIQALVDLDVFTPNDWQTSDAKTAKDWVENAHTYEKEEFFKLFSKDMMDRLVEQG